MEEDAAWAHVSYCYRRVGRRLERGRSLPCGPGHAFRRRPRLSPVVAVEGSTGERRRALPSGARAARPPSVPHAQGKENRADARSSHDDRTRVCPARAGRGILERGGLGASGAHADPTPHIPDPPRAPRRRGAPGAGASWRSPAPSSSSSCSAPPARPPRSPRSTRSPSPVTAGATASACRSGAPTATPSTAGPTRRSSSTTTPASRSRPSTDTTVRVRLRSGLSAVKLTCPNDFTVQGTGGPRRSPAVRPRRPPGPAAATASSPARSPRLHRRADLHADGRRAPPPHDHRPRRQRRLPRHDQGARTAAAS